MAKILNVEAMRAGILAELMAEKPRLVQEEQAKIAELQNSLEQRIDDFLAQEADKKFDAVFAEYQKYLVEVEPETVIEQEKTEEVAEELVAEVAAE